ncbi:MAG: segregation and condensation protein A [Candidatus Tyloplasma litorale]|nr:MAG: segregation and condensation protein A [Mycoplasmatales bacterium]
MIVDDFDKTKLTLENFEGPLDLLLFLIKKKKFNILKISLVQVADQYLNFINAQETIDLDETSEYLLLACQLIDIKSKHLLKFNSFGDKKEKIDEENLLERLIEYEKIKTLSEELKKLHNKTPFFEKLDDDFQNYIDLELQKFGKLTSKGKKDLEKAVLNIDSSIKKNKLKKKTIRITKKSSEIVKKEIIKSINEGFLTLSSILKSKDKYYISLSLLIILEMSRNNEIFIYQENDYGEIKIRLKNYEK